MVSEVSFPRFWGVLSIAKWSPFFVSVIGSAVSEISPFYVKFCCCCNNAVESNGTLFKILEKIQVVGFAFAKCNTRSPLDLMDCGIGCTGMPLI